MRPARRLEHEVDVEAELFGISQSTESREMEPESGEIRLGGRITLENVEVDYGDVNERVDLEPTQDVGAAGVELRLVGGDLSVKREVGKELEVRLESRNKLCCVQFFLGELAVPKLTDAEY